MISQYFILWILGIVNAVIAFLPKVTELPFGVDSYIQMGAGYFNTLSGFFPPFATLMSVFLFYMAFKVTMMSLRLLRIIR